MIGGILSTLQNLRGGFCPPFHKLQGVLCPPCKKHEGCFVHLCQNEQGVFCPGGGGCFVLHSSKIGPELNNDDKSLSYRRSPFFMRKTNAIRPQGRNLLQGISMTS